MMARVILDINLMDIVWNICLSMVDQRPILAVCT